MNKNIEIISLIYRSKSYLNFIAEQLKSSYCNVAGWNVGVRIVANDPTNEIIEELPSTGLPHTIYNDPTPESFYLNRVYRCWNHAVATSKYDNVCLVNSDMAFSDAWLENLLKHHNGKSIPCSRLVESGKMPSGRYGLQQDFGKHPKSFRVESWDSWSKKIKLQQVKNGGLFMPCVFNKKQFLSLDGYPEGNVFMGNTNEVEVGHPNDRPVFKSGDAYFFDKMKKKLELEHVTVFDSVVYHIQEGEMDE
tara:strand:- start:4138 stop:4884 length:747 start_codon:yes stop_codon:yes gene_type:complete